MKKIMILLTLILCSILFIACSNTSDNVKEEVKVPEQEVVLDEIETSPTNDVDTLPEAEQESEVETIEQTEKVEIEYRYVLQSDYTVKPIDEGTNENVVLLTIDDAPERYSVEMAQLLKEKQINAIFFVNGHFINNEAGREKLQIIHNLGFEIGNHTMNHPNLKKLTEEEQRQEIIELNNLIEEITGERPRFFRAPFGVNTDISRQVAAEENMQWMNWSYGYDFVKGYMEKEALVDIMVNAPELRAGANLLMHDREWTLEALPQIISGLKEKGYDFVDPKMIKGKED